MRLFARFTTRPLTAVAALTVCASVGLSSTANAQSNEVSPTGKGIAGGALLGAEAVMLTEALLDVKPAWAYAVGGLVGGIGGGVAGYFAEQGSNAKLPLYLLAGGMALAIPTTVAVLSATGEPAARAPRSQRTAHAHVRGSQTKRAAAARLQQQLRLSPPALVGLGDGYVAVSVPAVEVRDVFTTADARQYGLTQQTEVRVPVLSYSF